MSFNKIIKLLTDLNTEIQAMNAKIDSLRIKDTIAPNVSANVPNEGSTLSLPKKGLTSGKFGKEPGTTGRY